MTHLILEMSDHEHWGNPAHLIGKTAPSVIPAGRRPTMLQVDRETAEREAVRLAKAHPGGRFVVFAPVSVGLTTDVPTHVNIDGKVICSRKVPAIAEIHDPDEIPF